MTFDDIPPDKEATFKQYRALAYKFAGLNEDLVPGTNIHQLAKIIQGTMWGYHQKRSSPLTHKEVQDFFESPVLPDYYLKEIKAKPNVDNSELQKQQKNESTKIIKEEKESLLISLKSRNIKKGSSLADLADKKIKSKSRSFENQDPSKSGQSNKIDW